MIEIFILFFYVIYYDPAERSTNNESKCTWYLGIWKKVYKFILSLNYIFEKKPEGWRNNIFSTWLKVSFLTFIAFFKYHIWSISKYIACDIIYTYCVRDRKPMCLEKFF